MLKKDKRVLAAIAEVTPGTAVTPTSADMQFRDDIDWTPKVEFEDDKVATGDHGEQEAVSGIQTMEFKGKISLKGAAAVNTIPDWSYILEACGLKRTAHGTTGQSWAMHTDNEMNTLTMWGLHHEAGPSPQQLAAQARGVKGMPKLICEGRGKPVKWDLGFKGCWYADDDIVTANRILINAPSAQVPEKFLSNTVTIHGVTYRANSFEMDWAAVLAPVPDASNATGNLHFYLKSWAPRLKISVELPRVATVNHRNMLTNMTVGVVSVGIGTNWNLTLPRAQLVDRTHVDLEGVEYMDLLFRALPNRGSDASMDTQTQAELLYGSKT
jgi:hypothetical protein